MNGSQDFTRREAMLLAAASAGAALFDGGVARADAATVTGVVFEDHDGSGKAAGNPGLPGVLVSNGKDVAVTDAQGRYTLPLPGPVIVFVIKPAGFTPPVDRKTGHHHFYYIHQPEGTPASLNLTYDGIEPTGPLPASLDFALVKQDEPDAFEAVLITDPQPETDVELGFVRDDTIEALAGIDARF